MEEVKNVNSTSEEFAKLVEKFDFKEVKRGDIVEGKVVKVGQNDVIVDIGYKQEGFIPIEECKNPLGEITVSEGSFVKALVKRITPNEIILSKKEADKRFGWEKLLRAYEKNIPILGTIVSKARKGFIVDMGINLFMPYSQVDIKPLKNKELDEFVGKEVRMKVLRIDKVNKTGIVSRRAILEEDIKEKRRRFFSSVKVGDKVRGKVVLAKKTFAIVEIDGNIRALLPKKEASWGFLVDIRDKVRIGREYEFKIKEVNKEKEELVLSLKDMYPDPWIKVPKKYTQGMKIKGKVVRFTKNRRSAIVEIEEGVEAVLRGEDITWSSRFVPPDKVLDINSRVIGVVLDVQPEKRLIIMGLKQLEPSPWEKFLDTYKEGDVIEVTVKKITNSGVIVNIMDGVDGFIRKSDLTWSYIDDPSEVVKEGEKLKAIILEINDETDRIRLGVKQLEGDKWNEYFAEHKEGDIVKVKVKKEIKNGIVVELAEGVEGIVRKNEISKEKFENISDVINVGDEVEALIMKIDRTTRKVLLSIKRALFEKEKREFEKYKKAGEEKKLTIGDLIKQEIEKKGKSKK